VLYSEIFRDLIFDTFSDSLEDWDNGSKDEAVPGIASPDDCMQACANNFSCFQSLYASDTCTLGTNNFRLGERHKPTRGERWHSSWNRTRIEAWASRQELCKKISFPFED
jgi:hypothetical protein